jgi:hypothetical protein
MPHPMYLGLLIMEAGWLLILGSFCAYVGSGLRRELPCYAEHMQRTRYRIIP